MSSFAFIFDIFFSCIITIILLYRCGNYRRQHPITTGAVFIAWFFSILIVFILPLDISLVCTFHLKFYLMESYCTLQAAYRDCLSHAPTTIKPIINGSAEVKFYFYNFLK